MNRLPVETIDYIVRLATNTQTKYARLSKDLLELRCISPIFYGVCNRLIDPETQVTKFVNGWSGAMDFLNSDLKTPFFNRLTLIINMNAREAKREWPVWTKSQLADLERLAFLGANITSPLTDTEQLEAIVIYLETLNDNLHMHISQPKLYDAQPLENIPRITLNGVKQIVTNQFALWSVKVINCFNVKSHVVAQMHREYEWGFKLNGGADDIYEIISKQATCDRKIRRIFKNNGVDYMVSLAERTMGKNYTPLHHAVCNARSDTVRYLLRNFANPNLISEKFGTPMHCLSQIANPESCVSHYLFIIYNLIDKGASLSSRDYNNQTVLMSLSGVQYCFLCYILWVRGGGEKSLHLRNNLGETALHYAARSGSLEVNKFLLEKGADMHVRDYQGKTPWNICQQRDRSFFSLYSSHYMRDDDDD